MHHLTRLASLVTALTFAHAAPTISTRQAGPAPINTQCINFEYRQEWLIADCLTGEDATTRIQSAVYLRNKIGNNDGSLQWEADGNYARSCDECKLLDSNAVLSCSCNTAWGTGKPSKIPSTFSLDSHISSYSGHLLSNLTSVPTVPSTPSQHPIPSSFRYSWGGLATCPEAAPSEYDFCRQNSNACATSTNKTWDRDTTFGSDGPVTCYVPFLYFPDYHFQFEMIKFVSEGAWEMIAYADEGCMGEEMRIGYADRGICRAVEGERLRAFTVRPVFNGDPR